MTPDPEKIEITGIGLKIIILALILMVGHVGFWASELLNLTQGKAPVARYEIAPIHPSGDSVGVWRLDRFSGEVVIFALQSGKTLKINVTETIDKQGSDQMINEAPFDRKAPSAPGATSPGS